MHNLKVVLIPYWLRDLVTQQGLNANSLIDYNAIQSALSADNKITFLSAQTINLGLFNAKDLSCSVDVLSQLWETTGAEHSLEIQSYLKQANVQAQDNTIAQLRLELDTSPVSNVAQSEKGALAGLLEILDMGNGTVGLVIEPHVAKITEAQMYLLLQKVIGIFYKYESPYHVATLPVFRTYLDFMRTNSALSA